MFACLPIDLALDLGPVLLKTCRPEPSHEVLFWNSFSQWNLGKINFGRKKAYIPILQKLFFCSKNTNFFLPKFVGFFAKIYENPLDRLGLRPIILFYLSGCHGDAN